MKIWILQTGEPLHIDSKFRRPMRAMNLTNTLLERGHNVTLWSSDFDHFSKSHRFGVAESIKLSDNLTIRLIKSRGYSSNFGLARLVDHGQLAWEIRKMLKSEDVPDVAFIGFPPIEPAFVLTSWLRKRNVPTLLDIKDAWPDIVLKMFPSYMRGILDMGMLPYRYLMRSTLRNSTGIISVSEAFLDWSLKKIPRSKHDFDLVSALTAPEINYSHQDILSANTFWDAQGVFDDGRMRAYFVGSLNNTFDFEPIISAARKLNIEFVIAGDGPLRSKLLQETQNIINVKMPGSISELQSQILAQRSRVALAPVMPRQDFELSTPNKFIDALRYGKPVISSITGITRDLITQYHVGLVYDSKEEFFEKIDFISSNELLVSQMQKNARDLFLKDFEFNKVYGQLAKHLEFIARRI